MLPDAHLSYKYVSVKPKLEMRITFLLVGGFKKFKVIQKAYLENIKYIALNWGRGVN